MAESSDVVRLRDPHTESRHDRMKCARLWVTATDSLARGCEPIAHPSLRPAERRVPDDGLAHFTRAFPHNTALSACS
jgi:hypothetical protein